MLLPFCVLFPSLPFLCFPPLANVPPWCLASNLQYLQTGVSGSLVSFLMLRENLIVWLSLLKPASSPSLAADLS